MHAKQGQCESRKKEYAAELQKTNNAQQNHYNNIMPQVFQVRARVHCTYMYMLVYIYMAVTSNTYSTARNSNMAMPERLSFRKFTHAIAS